MKVIILVGVPGAGKSTLAKTQFPGYMRVNQDELGDRLACIKAMQKALSEGKDVIVDRTNINKKQRKVFIDLALQMGADSVNCIYLDIDDEEAIARIHLRKHHETIRESMSLEVKKGIVYQFRRSLEIPELSEGFNSIIITRA
jgi:predicted kinase